MGQGGVTPGSHAAGPGPAVGGERQGTGSGEARAQADTSHVGGEPIEQLKLLQHGCAQPASGTGVQLGGPGSGSGLSTPIALQTGGGRRGSRAGDRSRNRRGGGGKGASGNDSATEMDPVAVRLLQNVLGLPVLTYVCESADGYRLRLIRIPRRGSSRVAYFQHGLLDSSSAWVSGGRVFGMGVRAWKAGYDVYLGNLRGTDDTLGYGALVGNYAHMPRAGDAGPMHRDSPGAGGSSATSDTSAGAGDRRGTSAGTGRRDRSTAKSSTGTQSERPATSRTSIGPSLRLRAHRSLAPADHEFWRFTVEDHTLDVMALVDRIHDIKRAEGRQRQAWQLRRGGKRSEGRKGKTTRPVSKERGKERPGPSKLSAESRSRGQADPEQEQQPRRSGSAAVNSAAGHGQGAKARGPSDAGRSSPRGSPSLDFSMAEDVRITGVGHSMGGCLLLLHILQCRALGRPHRISRAILLSPAGMHKSVKGMAYYLIHLAYPVVHLLPHGPFMRAPRALQRVVARLAKDFVGQQSTADALAAVSSSMFGGVATRFAFRDVVDVTEYNVGGTSIGVMRHGCQGLIAREINAYDHGEARNRIRYGNPTPPNLRLDFGLIDVPIHFVAGGLDVLIPPENIELMARQLQALRPGIATYHCFPDLGHLDFTLSRDDGLVQFVLQKLREPEPETSATQWMAQQRWMGTRPGGVDQAPSHLMRYPHAAPGVAEAAAAAVSKHLLVLDPELAAITRESAARARFYANSADGPYKRASLMAKDFPFLGTFMKLSEAWAGIDARAAWERQGAAARAIAAASNRSSSVQRKQLEQAQRLPVPMPVLELELPEGTAVTAEMEAAGMAPPGNTPGMPGGRTQRGGDPAPPGTPQIPSSLSSSSSSVSGSSMSGASSTSTDRRRRDGERLPPSPTLSRQSSAASSLTMMTMLPLAAGSARSASRLQQQLAPSVGANTSTSTGRGRDGDTDSDKKSDREMMRERASSAGVDPQRQRQGQAGRMLMRVTSAVEGNDATEGSGPWRAIAAAAGAAEGTEPGTGGSMGPRGGIMRDQADVGGADGHVFTSPFSGHGRGSGSTASSFLEGLPTHVARNAEAKRQQRREDSQ